MTEPALKLVDQNDQLANELDKVQEPVEYLQPAYDALVQKSNELAEDVRVRRASIDSQLADIEAFDQDYETRRAEMVERYEADRSELTRQTDAQKIVRQSMVDMAAHFKGKSSAPKAPKPKAVSRSRGKAK